MAGQKMTKSQFVAAVAEKCGVSKKQAVEMLDAVNAIVVKQLGKQGPGEVTIPGLLKLTVKEKPAVPEHEGINPFTKEPTIIKAKPASRAVKARAIKALNDAV